MKRRQFVFSAASLAVSSGCGVLPFVSGLTTPRVPRVGILGTTPTYSEAITGLEEGLSELGYVDRKNIAFERRDSGGSPGLNPELANELTRIPVDVIVAFGSSATPAAQQASTKIPVVFAVVTDPVSQGLVARLDHPGGNLTGITNAPPTMFPKQLQILGQLMPRLSRVVTISSYDPALPLRLQAINDAANAMGVQLRSLDVPSSEDVEPALAEALAWQAQAMMIFTAAIQIRNAFHRFADFQVHNRMPLACDAKDAVQAGCLLFYGASFNGLGRSAATLVDKILKGARPGDLPVEQPTTFDFVVNQTTAQALGITIPPDIALQVTEWVQ
jgi:putative ABC transport system substrate-binding protein